MTVNVIFHNMDQSDAVVRFIEKKSQKLQKFFHEPASVKVVIDRVKRTVHPHLNINLGGRSYSVSSQADNAFIAIDGVFEKAKRQLEKWHNKKIQCH